MQEPGRGGGLRNQAIRSSQTRQPSVASLVTSLTSQGDLQNEEEFRFLFLFFNRSSFLSYILWFCVCRWISKRGKSRLGAILSRAGTREGYWAGTSFLSFLFLETWVHSTCVSRIANPEFFGTGWPAGWVSLYADSLFFSGSFDNSKNFLFHRAALNSPFPLHLSATFLSQIFLLFLPVALWFLVVCLLSVVSGPHKNLPRLFISSLPSVHPKEV